MEATMIPYDKNFDPPAPVIEVVLSNVRTRRLRVIVPAILDTAADITAIPQHFIERLKLYQISTINVEGVNGVADVVKTYHIRLQVGSFTQPQLQVIPVNFEFAVLARDVLNELVIHLDGPELTFTIGE
jgi:hypothetical protein